MLIALNLLSRRGGSRLYPVFAQPQWRSRASKSERASESASDSDDAGESENRRGVEELTRRSEIVNQYVRGILEKRRTDAGARKCDFQRGNYKFLNYEYANNRSRKAKPLNYKNLTIDVMESPPSMEAKNPPRLVNGLEEVVKRRCLMPTNAVCSMAGMENSNFFYKLPTPEEIDYDSIGDYIPPSRDTLLRSLAQRNACKYIMSTSTITSLMVHADYLLTMFRSPLFQLLSHEYTEEPLRYMISARKPNLAYATVVCENPRIIAIDSESGFSEGPSSLILLKMGKYLESMMTHSEHDFNRKFLMKNKASRLPTDKPLPEFYSFLRAGNMMLRSQIDSGMQDGKILRKIEIKTRGVTPQRYDIDHYMKYYDYKLTKTLGLFESFEREYYDLIRGGFIKYVHQMTIGDMDGVIIAYHNTQEIFGFEYLSKWHLEKRIYGSQEFASVCFRSSLTLLQQIFDYIFDHEGMDQLGQTLKIGLYASNSQKGMVVMAERIDNVNAYKKRLTEDMSYTELNDVIDQYEKTKLQPQVNKYFVNVYPRLNGVVLPSTVGVFHEPRDNLEYDYEINKLGKVDVASYMLFLHEAYKSEYKNIENEYSGTWSSKTNLSTHA